MARRKKSARQRIDEHERMVLVGADRDAFLEAILNPPEPTDELMAALRRHRAREVTTYGTDPNPSR